MLVPSLGGMEVGPLEHDGGSYAPGGRVLLGEVEDSLVVVGSTRLTTSGGGPGGPVVWDDIGEKPVVFPPAPHTHSIGQVDGLGEALEDIVPGIPAYEEGESYAAGSVVEHNDRWWRAKVDTTDEPAPVEDQLPDLVAAVNANTQTATPSVTLPPDVREGDLLVLQIASENLDQEVTSVSDEAGNTWTKFNFTVSPSNALTESLWTATAVAGSAGAQVNAAVSTSRRYTMTVYVFRGVTSGALLADSYETTGTTSSLTWLAAEASSSWMLSTALQANVTVATSIPYTFSGLNSERVEVAYQTRGAPAGPAKYTAAHALFRFDDPVAGSMTLTLPSLLYYRRHVCLVLTGTEGAPNDWEMIDTFAPPEHRHDAIDITSGVFPYQRLPQAGEGAPGVAGFATDAEVQAGTVSDRTVTPATLASLTASQTRRGLAEAATDAEAITATDTLRYVSPANLKAVFEKRGAGRPPVASYLPPARLAGVGTAALRSGEFCAIAIDVEKAATFSGLAYRLTTAIAGATCVFSAALYNDAGEGVAPNLTSRVATTATDPASTVSGSGPIDLAFTGGAVTLQPGRYWIGMLAVLTGTPTTAPAAAVAYPVLPVVTTGLFWLLNGLPARYLRATGLATLPTTNITLTYEAWDAPYLMAMKRSA